MTVAIPMVDGPSMQLSLPEIFFIYPVNESTWKLQRLPQITFVETCFFSKLLDRHMHEDACQNKGTLVNNIKERYCLGDETLVDKAAFLQAFNKELQDMM